MVDLTADVSETSTAGCQSLDRYRCHGWQLIEGWLSTSEVATLAAEADRLANNTRNFETRGTVRASAARTDRLDPVIDLSAVYRQLAFGPRLVDLASLALVAEARLLKDKLIYKPPNANGYAVHQDFAYWQDLGYDSAHFVTICLCIDAMTTKSGAVEFARGTNWALLTPSGEVTDPTEYAAGPFETCSAEAGDAILFSSLVPHRSSQNISSASRRALFLTYVRSSTIENPYLDYRQKVRL